MAREANVWIVIADEVLEQIKDHIGDPEYDGLLINLVRFLNRQADYRTTSKKWKRPTIAGKVRVLFSVNYGQNDDLAEIKAAIDELSAELGTDFGVAGAWWWTGIQPTEEGLSMYPINHVQLLKFMPDVWDNGVLVPATVLANVNIIQGQAPRDFT